MAKDEGPRVVRWDDVPREQLNELLARKFITGERVMLAHIYLDKGCVVPMHQHENEQLSYILEGELKFRIGSEDSEPVFVKAGEVLVSPPNLPHSAEAVEDTLSLDVFSPPRQDWLTGNDDYLRK
jgi:quercetin dioxygenase-like cupin family protein